MAMGKKATTGDGKRHRPIRGPQARAEAARLLGEGFAVAEVARRLGLSRQTVSEWKNHAEAPAVAAASEKRAETFADAVAEARSVLKGAAAKAANVLVAHLDDEDPAVASAAARTLLDRVGVPRTERVETDRPDAPDLSRLTPEQFEQLRAIKLALRGDG